MPAPSVPVSSPQRILEAAAAPTLAAGLVVVSEAVRVGQTDLALGFLEALRKQYGQDPGIDLVEASLRARIGQFEAALQLVKRAGKVGADCATTKLYEAQLMIQAGLKMEGLKQLRALVAQCPDFPGLAGILAKSMMPGQGYREVLAALHQRIQPRGYLEVGVETGATLALSHASCTIGIDPDLSVLKREMLSEHCKLFEMTSARFFELHSSKDVLRDVPLDLVFIDGLHQFESAISDFACAERWCHEDSVLVMHDALPIAPEYATVERQTRFWAGDVWKAVPLLMRARPELRIRIIATPPSGLVVVTRLRQREQLEARWHEGHRSEINAMSLSPEVPPWPAEFPIVANSTAGYDEALGRRQEP